MIEAISRQASEMIELQNSHQRLLVNSDFAAAFRGATQEAQGSGELSGKAAAGPLQRAIESGVTALSAGRGQGPLVGAVAPVSTASTPAASPSASPAAPVQSDVPAYPAGWSGPPGQVGSSYNPIAAWDQVPGQQPSWVSGNYPGATWTDVNEAGFLMPYSNLSPGPGEDALSSANDNVINQGWTKYYDQVDGTAAGNQIVWGANNPTEAITAPWMAANNPAAQYTVAHPSDPSQPTQPNYVAPAV